MIWVLARAYADEPLKLQALSDWGNAIEVAKGDEDKPIGFPARFVFDFDETLYAALRQAFRKGDRTKLLNMWTKATPFDPRTIA